MITEWACGDDVNSDESSFPRTGLTTDPPSGVNYHLDINPTIPHVT